MIKIMVDSSSDCKKEDNIYDYFIPITVNIGGKEYRDGVDLDSDTFYDLLINTQDFPVTSQPSPDVFVQIFEQVKERGDELIYLCLSSTFSGTYQSANIAKAMVEYDGIYIVDTLSVTRMIFLLARYAKRLVVEGNSSQEIIEKCLDVQKRIRLIAGVDTLEYLKKGGRIGKAAALVGTLANIKPILTVTKEGVVDSVGKGLGFGKAVQMIADKVDNLQIDEEFPIYSVYTYGTENCEKLEEKLKSAGYNVAERLQIGSTIGTHVGPGLYGVLFVAKNRI